MALITTRGPGANEAWWAPYARWPVAICTLVLVLAAAGVPVLADTALLPGVLLPVLLSTRGPLAGRGLPILLRLACVIGPVIVIHARNPDYSATVRGPGPPPWVTDVPTRAQVWAQIAAVELLLLLIFEALTLGTLWAVGRRRAARQAKG